MCYTHQNGVAPESPRRGRDINTRRSGSSRLDPAGRKTGAKFIRLFRQAHSDCAFGLWAPTWFGAWKGSQNPPKINQNPSQILPKSLPNRPKWRPREGPGRRPPDGLSADYDFSSVLAPSGRFWSPIGTPLGPEGVPRISLFGSDFRKNRKKRRPGAVPGGACDFAEKTMRNWPGRKGENKDSG